MRITCLLECDDIMHAAESDSRIGYTVYAKEFKKKSIISAKSKPNFNFWFGHCAISQGPRWFQMINIGVENLETNYSS